jgi:hypothetical protein
MPYTSFLIFVTVAVNPEIIGLQQNPIFISSKTISKNNSKINPLEEGTPKTS